jgi:hypothetical protein
MMEVTFPIQGIDLPSCEQVEGTYPLYQKRAIPHSFLMY